jgi:ribosome-associated toxin RatA of RatAB toxin-antitoxin module
MGKGVGRRRPLTPLRGETYLTLIPRSAGSRNPRRTEERENTMHSPITAAIALALAVNALPNGTDSPLLSSPADDVLAPAAGAVATDEPRIESLPVPGSGIERVRATVAIRAPLDRVRAVLFDYDRYPEFVPRYQKASVIRITPSGARLVQTELGGVVRLWMRFEISPPVNDAGVEKYEGHLEQGNIKAFRPRWELEPLTGDRTRITMESFLDPDLPLVPSSLVNSGTREGMRDAIVALKARIEGRRVAAR